MFKRFIAASTKSVTFAALLIGLASLLSRLIGVFRDRLLSGAFGASRDLDIYYAAFRVPDLMYGIVVGGVVTAGFIPVFTRYLGDHANAERGVGEPAARLADRLVTALGSVLVLLAVVGQFLAPWFVPKIAPGFGADDMARAVQLTRIMLSAQVFLGLSNIFGGILQSKRRFAIYSLAPILYNVGIVAGTLLLAPRYGVLGPAVGVVAGSFLHFLAQAWACRDLGYSFRPAFDVGHEGVRQVARMTGVRFASIAAAQANNIILTGIASTLGAGSIAVYTLANNLQLFPTSVIGTSFAIAAFPVISDLAAKDRREDFVLAVTRTVRNILFMIVPATVLLLLLRAQIVRVVLGTGRFDWADTIATADTLAFFGLSLFSQALWPLLARACFALEDALSPLWAVIAGIAVERALAAQLVARDMGTPALALAFSAGSVVTIAWLWVALRRLAGRPLGERMVLMSVAKTTAAAALMAFAVQWTKSALAGIVDMQTFLGIALQGTGAGLAGIAVFVASAYMFGSEEARNVVAMYTRRFAPAPVPEIKQEDGTLGA